MEQHPLYHRVIEALKGIRPYLEADGGNVEIVEITPENEVKIQFQGTCVSCSMSDMTFKGGIEASILKAVPEVIKVTSV